MINKTKLYMVFAMTIFGSMAPLVKNISLGSGEIALYRSLIALIVIGIFFVFSKNKLSFKLPKKEVALLFLSGAALGFNWIFLFEAYKYTSVSIAALCYYFAPVILVAVSPLLFRERLSPLSVICIFLATAGLFMIIGVSGNAENKSSIIGIILGLIAAILYATVIVLNKFISSVDGLNRTFLQFLTAGIILIPYVLLTDKINILTLNKTGIVSLIILGVVHSGFAYCLYFTSVKKLSGAEVAILSYIDPLIAVFISFAFLKEHISLLQAIGGFIILISTLINELLTKKVRAD